LKKKYTLPEDYRNEFTKSHNTFKHQLVYNPISKILVPLTPFDNETNKDLEYIGEYIDGEVAQKIAEGYYNPCTKEPFEKIKSKSNYVVCSTTNVSNYVTIDYQPKTIFPLKRDLMSIPCKITLLDFFPLVKNDKPKKIVIDIDEDDNEEKTEPKKSKKNKEKKIKTKRR